MFMPTPQAASTQPPAPASNDPFAMFDPLVPTPSVMQPQQMQMPVASRPAENAAWSNQTDEFDVRGNPTQPTRSSNTLGVPGAAGPNRSPSRTPPPTFGDAATTSREELRKNREDWEKAQVAAKVDAAREHLASEEREKEEKRLAGGEVDQRCEAWAGPKSSRKNIRALLTTIQTVMWDNSRWNTVGLHEVVQPQQVRKVYRKAILQIHPDKLPPDASVPVQCMAQKVFDILQSEYDKFRVSENV